MCKNIIRYLSLLLLWPAGLGVTSCSGDEPSGGTAPRPVVLKAEIFSFNSSVPTVWAGGQSVGVYMLKSGTQEVYGEYANVEYLADNRGTTGYLVPVSNTPIYLPADGSRVDFRVYYPYDKTVQTRAMVKNTTRVEIDESTPGDGFLYSQNSRGVSYNYNQSTVQIKSMLSVVKMDVYCNVTDAYTLTATIRHTATRAVFDLLEGAFTERKVDEEHPLELNVTKQGEDDQMQFTMQATLLSGEVEEDAVIEISVENKQGEVVKTYEPAPLSEVMELPQDEGASENTSYEVDVQLNENSNQITTQVTAKTQIVILNWTGGDDDSETGVARPTD